MKINRTKTKVIVVSNKKKILNIQMRAKTLEQVGSIKYLSTKIDKTKKF